MRITVTGLPPGAWASFFEFRALGLWLHAYSYTFSDAHDHAQAGNRNGGRAGYGNSLCLPERFVCGGCDRSRRDSLRREH